MDTRNDVNLCFLDFCETFDIVCHRNSCSKPTTLGVYLQVVEWVLSCLNMFYVRIDDVINEEPGIHSVVRQCPAIGQQLILVKMEGGAVKVKIFRRSNWSSTKQWIGLTDMD